MKEELALRELTIENLLKHCINQCTIHKGSKLGYEHYIFMQLLKESYARNIEDYIIDYSLICKGEFDL